MYCTNQFVSNIMNIKEIDINLYWTVTVTSRLFQGLQQMYIYVNVESVSIMFVSVCVSCLCVYACACTSNIHDSSTMLFLVANETIW